MTLPQGSAVKSMDFHPLQQILLLGKQPQYIEQLFPSLPVCVRACTCILFANSPVVSEIVSFVASLFQLEQAWVMSWYGSWAAEKGLVGRISRFGTITQGLRRYILISLMEYEVIMILSGAVISG